MHELKTYSSVSEVRQEVLKVQIDSFVDNISPNPREKIIISYLHTCGISGKQIQHFQISSSDRKKRQQAYNLKFNVRCKVCMRS